MGLEQEGCRFAIGQRMVNSIVRRCDSLLPMIRRCYFSGALVLLLVKGQMLAISLVTLSRSPHRLHDSDVLLF